MCPYSIYDPSEEENWFSVAFKIAQDYASSGNWKTAQNIALWWGEGICDSLKIPYTDNWKFLKRALAANWFGKTQSKKFLAPWKTTDALEYALSFSDKSVRFSLFPKDIACHAVSSRLPIDRKDTWATILNTADTTIDMEMFPEASTKTSICFRRYTSAFREVTIYEAGKGQAMYVFEQERGKHSTVVASRFGADSSYEFAFSELNPSWSSKQIMRELGEFVCRFDCEISRKCFWMCRKLGIDYLSIEGYYDPLHPDGYIIVDIDLPFDVFFLKPNS
ncbi:MAG: hypothetical protein ACOYZ8_04295 [Chloroflexota bacterium]